MSELPREQLLEEYDEFVWQTAWRELYGYDDSVEDFLLTKCFMQKNQVILKKDMFDPIIINGGEITVRLKNNGRAKQYIVSQALLNSIRPS